METSLKPGFAQIFSCCPKNLSCPKFWGGCSPPRPPPRPVRLCVWGERRKKENLLTPWVLKTMNDIRSSLRMGRGFSQTQHNEHNGSFLTCHSDKPTCSRTLPLRDSGSGGPHFLCGSGGGAQLLVEYIYFFSFVYRSVKVFFLISR